MLVIWARLDVLTLFFFPLVFPVFSTMTRQGGRGSALAIKGENFLLLAVRLYVWLFCLEQ